MRLAVYGTVSTLAASIVVVSAFAQRANFYSATVYLAQSNACLMILTNFSLLCSLLLAHILQRILYGPLRDLEVESLYEKAWYAVTETCLAMTIFRDEWNVGFVLCFAGLLFAKGFCWLSSGRVEMMEQTPPANPRLFHTRLVASLVLLIASDIAMVYYAVSEVLDAGKPGMMVMFAFEFTILFITALSTAGRYGLIITEKFIVRKQINARGLARQAERAAEQRVNRDLSEIQPQDNDEDEDEELDLVWEEKGTWMFYLELGTDFLKLLTYLAFFFIVLTFYGLPLHIIRDVYITLRSFISRIRDFIRYRRATNDMNIRYPDATAEEVERENVCIICREEMRPYIPDNQGVQGVQAAAQTQQRQRSRPKKLPCGHILHFACLRSWLERQQRCPTCRRPVLEVNPNDTNPNVLPPGGQQQPDGRRGNGIAWGGQFGGIRVNFGVGQGPEFMQNLVQQWENRPPQAGNPGAGEPAVPVGQQDQPTQQQVNSQTGPSAGPEATLAPQSQIQSTNTPSITSLRGLHLQLLDLERRLRRELEAVEAVNTTLGETREMRARLSQVRQQHQQQDGSDSARSTTAGVTGVNTNSSTEPPSHTTGAIPSPPNPSALHGVSIPPGWQVIPLTPVSVGSSVATATPSANSSGAPFTIQPTPVQSLPSVGAFPTTLADLRRRRFGRGDVRSYSAVLREYHAVRSPGLERAESEGGLASVPGSDPENADQYYPNTLEQRFREVFLDSLALDESTALLNSAARELGAARSQPQILADNMEHGRALSSEYVRQAEREVGAALENRRSVIDLVDKTMNEARVVLERRRGTTMVEATSSGTSMRSSNATAGSIPEANTDAVLGAANSAVPQFSSMTLTGSPSVSSIGSLGTSFSPSTEIGSSADAEADPFTPQDKGKGKATTVESDNED